MTIVSAGVWVGVGVGRGVALGLPGDWLGGAEGVGATDGRPKAPGSCPAGPDPRTGPGCGKPAGRCRDCRSARRPTTAIAMAERARTERMW